jgi:transposase
VIKTSDISPSNEQLLLQNSLLQADVLELNSQINELKFQLLELRRIVFASKSERFINTDNSVQLPLGLVVDAIAEVETKEQEIKAHTRTTVELKPKNHHGRVPFGSHLKRVVTVLMPEGSTEGLEQTGIEVKETLECTPAIVFVNRTECPIFETKNKEKKLVASMPEAALGKSMFGNSFAAHLLVSKFVDHCPEHRMQQILKRSDVHVATSSLNEIPTMVAHCLGAVYALVMKQVLSASYLQIDETTMRVLTDKKPGKTHRGFYWVYRDPLNRLVFFDYQPDRTRAGPAELLKDFIGQIQTDGYSVYEEIRKLFNITLFFCWAHARRYFEKALKNDKVRASWMMEKIQLLYAIERRAREEKLSFADRLELRQRESIPVLAEIKAWLDKNKPSGTPKSGIGKAIHYTLKRWDGLVHYTTDGNVEIDNNWVENSIRPVTLGRKNYLFAGSHEGAARACIFYTFFAICKLRGINPYTWLKETLDRIPTLRSADLHTLIPGYTPEAGSK